MAGPKYNVGIRFQVQGNLNTTLNQLNAKMRTLAANAEKVNLAMNKAMAAQRKSINATSTTSKQAARHQIWLDEQKAKSAARVATVLQREGYKQSKVAGQVEKDKQREADRQAKAAAILGRQQAREQEKQTKAAHVEAEKRAREERARLRRSELEHRRYYGRMRSMTRGIIHGDVLGAAFSVATSPIALALEAVTYGLIKATEWSNKYYDALLGIERAGLSAAQAQKELNSFLTPGGGGGMHKYFGPMAESQLYSYIHTLFPGGKGSNVDTSRGGALWKTMEQGAQFLHQNTGITQEAAFGQEFGMLQALRSGMAAGGAGAKSYGPAMVSGFKTIFGTAASMGSMGGQYLNTMQQLLQDPAVMSAIGASRFGSLSKEVSQLMRGGMGEGSIAGMINVALGFNNKQLAAMFQQSGFGLNVGSLPAAIGGRALRLHRELSGELLYNPAAFTNRLLRSMGYSGGLSAVSKMPDSQLKALQKQITQDLGSIQGGVFADLVRSEIVNTLSGAQGVSPRKDWTKLLSPTQTHIDTFKASVGRLEVAVGRSGGAAGLIDYGTKGVDKVTGIVEHPVTAAPDFAQLVGATAIGGPGGMVINVGVMHVVANDVKQFMHSVTNSIQRVTGAGGQNTPRAFTQGGAGGK